MAAGIIFAILIGWLAGSLVNYLADVLPRRRRLVRPFCLACEAEAPGLSFNLFPMRCTACGAGRSWRVWLVFLAGAAGSVILWLAPDLRLPFWLNLLIWTYFSLVIVIDIEHRLILHSTSLVGAAIGMGTGVWLHGWLWTLIGGAAGFGFMLAMHMLGNLFTRWLSKRRRLKGEAGDEVEDALGFGDVILAGITGLFLGWPGVVAGLLVAVFLGGAVSLIYLIVSLILRRYQAFAAIPYGPFLALAALFLLYFRF